MIQRPRVSRSLTTGRQVSALIQSGRSARAINHLHGAAQEATIGSLVAQTLARVGCEYRPQAGMQAGDTSAGPAWLKPWL